MTFTTLPSVEWWDEHADQCALVLDDGQTFGASAVREEIDKLDAGAVVLDIGCYHGRLERLLAPHFQQVSFIGVDPGERIIAEANRRRDETALTNILYVRNDGATLASERDESADLVFSVATFQHLPEATARRYVWEIERVLRPGGVMCVQTVDTIRRFSTRDLAGWVIEAGLKDWTVTHDPDAQPGWAWRWVKGRKA